MVFFKSSLHFWLHNVEGDSFQITLNCDSMDSISKRRKRDTVIALAKEGYSPTDIITITDFPKKFVYRWYDKKSSKDAPRSGRPSKLTRAAKISIIKSMIGKPRRSTRLMAAELKRKHLANVDRKTVARYLVKSGAHLFHRVRQPKLSSDNKRKRHKFAIKYRHHLWEHAIFVDEKKFELFSNPNKQDDVVWAFDKSSVPGYEVSQFSPSVHVWGGISMRGVTPIVKLTGSVDGATYQQVLADNYLPAVQELYDDEECLLVQDKATPHTSRLVLDWLKENELKYIPPSDWPSNSPDLNPIENLWGYIQDRVNEKKIKSADGL